MKRVRRTLIVLATVLVALGLDQISKALVTAYLPRWEVLALIGGVIQLDYHENTGAVFSFEWLLPEGWRGSTVTVATSLFLGLTVAYLIVSPRLGTSSAMGLALACGGAMGNLLDRALLGGTVIDFLILEWNGLRSCVFNAADALIVLGLTIFGLSSVLKGVRRSIHRKSTS